MKTNPTELQVLANYCRAAAEAMAYTLMRTAHSTFVKETEDFSCGLLTTEGITFASPKSLGATWYIGLDYGPAIAMIESYEEGDICITNDPYSGSVATHTPDMHIWKPVFVDGELICFVGGHIHNTDMGGAVPATLSRTLTEIQQEGLRVPPVKLCKKGVMDMRLVKLMQANVRVPHQNWGDLNAQIASVAVGERKVKEIVARFGLKGFKDGIKDLLDYAEMQSREVIRKIPDGTYFHSEFADEDEDGGNPMRIALTLKVRGDDLILDYSGSDPQLSSSLNMPTGGRIRHVLAMVGLGYVLYTLDNNLILNAGTLMPAQAILPKGTVVHATFPAAVGMRSLTCSITQLATFGVFAAALPERMSASPAGGNTIMNVRTLNSKGAVVMASIGPVGGGAGGRPDGDGLEGAGANSSFLKNTPVEISESEIPIRFLRYGLWADSAGAGKNRGGSAAVMEFQVFTPQTMITARNRDRSYFSAWGLKGGKAGHSSSFILNPGTPQEIILNNVDIVHCEANDVIRIIGPGGGGWGHPMDRPLDWVQRDLDAGLISADTALNVYGAVSKDGKIDESLSVDRRVSMTRSEALFDYGVRLTEFKKLWDDERYSALTTVLARTAIPWRHWLKKMVFQEVARGSTDSVSARDQIFEIHDRLLKKYPQLDLPPD